MSYLFARIFLTKTIGLSHRENHTDRSFLIGFFFSFHEPLFLYFRFKVRLNEDGKEELSS